MLLIGSVRPARNAGRNAARSIIAPTTAIAARNDLSELVIARARSQRSRSAKIPILLIDALDLDSPGKDKVGAAPAALDVTFRSADTVMIGNGTSTDQMRVIIGSDGRIRGAKAGATAKDQHFSIRPTSRPVSSRE